MIQQTPWFQRQFHFDFPYTLFPVIFSRLEGSMFRLHHLLQTADDERSSYNPLGWSVKQHVGHLYDLEELWWKRLVDFQQHKAVLTEADLSNKKTEEANHNERPLEDLLNAFAFERQKMLETIYELDAVDLNQTSVHPRLNHPMRLIDFLYFVAEHDDHHIAIISSLLRKPIG
jgi:uncharacterized damage-inducible protein DinB